MSPRDDGPHAGEQPLEDPVVDDVGHPPGRLGREAGRAGAARSRRGTCRARRGRHRPARGGAPPRSPSSSRRAAERRHVDPGQARPHGRLGHVDEVVVLDRLGEAHHQLGCVAGEALGVHRRARGVALEHPGRGAVGDAEAAHPLADRGGVQEVLLDELPQRLAELVLAGDDHGRVRDGQAERVAEDGDDGEPVGQAADHRRLEPGPQVAGGPLALGGDRHDQEGERDQGQEAGGPALGPADVALPCGEVRHGRGQQRRHARTPVSSMRQRSSSYGPRSTTRRRCSNGLVPSAARSSATPSSPSRTNHSCSPRSQCASAPPSDTGVGRRDLAERLDVATVQPLAEHPVAERAAAAPHPEVVRPTARTVSRGSTPPRRRSGSRRVPAAPARTVRGTGPRDRRRRPARCGSRRRRCVRWCSTTSLHVVAGAAEERTGGGAQHPARPRLERPAEPGLERLGRIGAGRDPPVVDRQPLGRRPRRQPLAQRSRDGLDAVVRTGADRSQDLPGEVVIDGGVHAAQHAERRPTGTTAGMSRSRHRFCQKRGRGTEGG